MTNHVVSTRSPKQIEHLRKIAKLPRSPRNGGYDAIHKWLKKHYGKASYCENPDCDKKSIDFEWALIKGKKHEHVAENYHQLCVKCHWHYDDTKEKHVKQATSLKGHKLPQSQKDAISRAMKGRKITWGDKISLAKKGVKYDN